MAQTRGDAIAAFLRRNRRHIRNDINMSSSLVTELWADNIINDEMKYEMKALIDRGKPYDALEIVLENLKRKPDKVNDFCQCLRDAEMWEAADFMQDGVEQEMNQMAKTRCQPVRQPEVAESRPHQVSSESNDLDTSITSIDETDSEIKRLLNDPQNVYKMGSIPRGRAVIINNENFCRDHNDSNSKYLSNRYGTAIDRDKLKNIFTQLDFDVHIWEDCTAEVMRWRLTSESCNPDHRRADAFVLVILSHGTEGQVYGVDGRTVDIKEDIVRPFHGDMCKLLLQKPKLFFIQACQGDCYQHPVTADGGASPAVVDAVSVKMFAFKLDDDKPSTPSLSTDPQADILVTMSTVPGRVSFRSPEEGTWFIIALVEVLTKNAHKEDLLSMLIKVNKKVSENCSQGGHVQLSQQMVNLLKKVYFFPGYPSTIQQASSY